MIFIQITVGIIAGAGIYFVLADFLGIPLYAVSKASNNIGKQQKKKANPLEIWLSDAANFIGSKLRLDEYKKLQLESDLKTADMNISPEQHVAECIVKSLIIGVLAVPVLFISPVVSAVIIFIAVLFYLNTYKKVTNIIKEKRRRIENELPRLVANIEKSLVHSRDILGIIESFKENAGEELKRELEITAADMRSGNYEAALTRLESRVGSSMVSDVTRGLIGVIRGDETSVYWASLNLKFSDYQRQNLKIEASKAPKRVRKLSMLLLICFMLMYVVVIGEVLITSLGGLF